MSSLRRTRWVLPTLLSLAVVGCFSTSPLRTATRSEATRTSGARPSPVAPPAVPNAGVLSGKLLGPQAAILSNNGANLIGNNGAGIVSNAGAGYHLRYAAESLTPVADARVEVVDVQGRVLSESPVTTGADGAFRFARVNPSGPLVFVRARYRLAGRDVTMTAAVAAPRSGQTTASVTPASSLVAAKASSLLANGQVGEEALAKGSLTEAADRLTAAMSDRAVAAALLLPTTEATAVFDQLLEERADLAQSLRGLGLPVVAAPTPGASPGPSPSPSSSAGGATPTPGQSASPATAPQLSPSPTPTPWAQSPYLIERVAGSALGGMAVGSNRLGDTFMSLSGLVVTPSDAYIVADADANQLRRLPASGASTRIAGLADGSAGYDAGTVATSVRLNQPHGVAYDSVAGSVDFCDTGNHRLRHLEAGLLTTLAGGGADAGDTVAQATNARLDGPMGLARDTSGNMFFTERGTARVRRYDAAGHGLTTIASNVGDGPIALDRANQVVWVSKGRVVTAISGINGAAPLAATTPTLTLPATAATLSITGLAYDGAGSLYVAQTGQTAAGVPSDGRLYRVPVDASGRASGPPVVIAGTGGQSADPDAYAPPALATDGLTLLLAANVLAMGADGFVYAGHSYPTRWGQVLRLKPAP